MSEGAATIANAVLRVVRGLVTIERAAVRDAGHSQAFESYDTSLPSEPELVLVPAGSFIMGVPESESKREGTEFGDESARPQHRVTFSHSFLLGKYPVTRAEYAVFAWETGLNWQPPEFEQTERDPVVNVSFQDAIAYTEWLSRRTGHVYRLPSEAEWEYACRAGTRTARYWGEDAKPELANFDRKSTTEGGAHEANPWGVSDMLGNVWEWVQDVWHQNYHGSPEDGQAWIEHGDPDRRVMRGGSWNTSPSSGRAGSRVPVDPAGRADIAGFRIARTR